MLKFSVKKYKDWRMEKEGMTEEALNVILEFSGYDQYDGRSYDEMWKEGRLVIKDWCVDE